MWERKLHLHGVLAIHIDRGPDDREAQWRRRLMLRSLLLFLWGSGNAGQNGPSAHVGRFCRVDLRSITSLM